MNAIADGLPTGSGLDVITASGRRGRRRGDARGVERPAAAARDGGRAHAAGRCRQGKTVLILGAGVSGLCSAYQLDRAGYDCVMLEPQRRAGGRSLTVQVDG
jgi:hypothetical protein